jgi:tetratricopeptide (TPR) repeat protein
MNALKATFFSAVTGLLLAAAPALATETSLRPAGADNPRQQVRQVPVTTDLRSEIIPLTLEEDQPDATPEDSLTGALEQPSAERAAAGALTPSSKELAEPDAQILEDEREKVQNMVRKARSAVRQRIFADAEKAYHGTLVMNVPEGLHKSLMLELAYMYEMWGQKGKMAAVYEKFSELYPADPRMPQIYLRLGHLYREMGATDTAIARFYNVLNVSLSIPEESIPLYRELSQQAQLEIAETHFMSGDYEEAAKFYARVKRLDLDHDERQSVAFKDAYIDHLLKDYPAVVLALEQFLADYPESHLAPESHYLLATAYRHTNQPDRAMEQVMRLLRHRAVADASDERIWLYWQKKAANQMANEYYEKGDFYSALKIYQAMAPLSDDPDWQWPVIYQIGLCFERLGMYPKAKEAYVLLAEKELDAIAESGPGESLAALKQMAGWRLKHVDWADHTRHQLNDLRDNKVELSEREEAVAGTAPGAY